VSTPWHIVVATDLSPASAQAYRHAAMVAKTLGSDTRVSLLTVDEARMSASEGMRAAFADYYESVTSARESATTKATEAFDRWGVSAEVIERGGTPFRTIASFAREEQADLVVLARHTRGPLPRRLLGSTVKRLLRVTTVPVLIVPVDDGVGDAVQVSTPQCKHLVVPSDLSDQAGEAIEKTAHLAQRFGASVTALHVTEPLMWVPLLTGATLPPVPAGMTEETKDTALAALNTQLDGITAGVSITPSVVEGFAAETVCKTARQVGADWISLSATGKGATERFFLGSTAERVAADSHIPVLVWPNTPEPARLGQ